MIRISALNTDSSTSDSDEDSPKITKEAQEEITLSKYSKALSYQRNGEIDLSLHTFREIIEDDLPKLADKDGLPKKFVNLKYSCHRNVGMLFYKKNLKGVALDYYLDAAEIDNTDVTLFNRIGCIALEQEDYILAVQAFQKGLNCNPKHWPCLDKFIMLLYALREEVTCLYYISKAFVLDPHYLRGLALRYKIYKHNTAIKDYYKALYTEWDSDPPLDTPFDENEGEKLIEESETIAERILAQNKSKEILEASSVIKLHQPIEEYSWLAVGQSLIDMHTYITENNLDFFSLIELNKNLNKKSETSNNTELQQMDKTEDEDEISFQENEKDLVTNLEINEICANVISKLIDEIENEEKVERSHISSPNNNCLSDIIEINPLTPSCRDDSFVDDQDCDILDESERLVLRLEDSMEEDIVEVQEDVKVISNEFVMECDGNNKENDLDETLKNEDTIFESEFINEKNEFFDANEVAIIEKSEYFDSNEVHNVNDMEYEEEGVVNDEIDELVKITSELEKSEEKGEIITENLISDDCQMDLDPKIGNDLIVQENNDVTKNHTSDKDLIEIAEQLTSQTDRSDQALIKISEQLTSQTDSNEKDLIQIAEQLTSHSSDKDLINITEQQERNQEENSKTTVITEDISESVTEEVVDSENKVLEELKTVNDELKTVTKIEDEKTIVLQQNVVEISETDKEEGPSATDTEGPSATDDPKEKEFIKSKVTKQTNRRRRSSLSMLEIWGWHSKRRSNRSKPRKGQRVARDDSIRGALKRILPVSLYSNNSETVLDGEIEKNEDESDNKSLSNANYFGTNEETVEVKNFWDKFITSTPSTSFRCDMITLLEYYVPAVAAKWDKVWPNELINVFIQAYELYRLYFSHPCILDPEVCVEKLQTDAEITLLYGELISDLWFQKCNNNINISMEKSFPLEAEAQIWFVACKTDDWNENYASFFTRVFFLKTILAINRKNICHAIELLLKLISELEHHGYDDSLQITLPNCKYNAKVSMMDSKNLLQALERFENLNKIVTLFDHRQFDQIISILIPTFTNKIKEDRLDSAPGGADRPLQIVMLLDCFWHKNNFEECILWTVKGLKEAFNEYTKSDENSEIHLRWQTVVIKCLTLLETCLQKEGSFLLDILNQEALKDLVETLASIISHQVESEDNVTSLPFETVSPWILLHLILQREEDKGRIKLSICERKSASGSDEDDDEDDIPPSLLILFSGHTFLGQRSWCDFNEGQLLLFILDIVMPSLRSPFYAPIRVKINQQIEQVFYCLYQHPSKKNNKVRYLKDHNVSPQKLSWQRAQQLYDFYRPDYIPEFDAYKIESITTETEGLLKRIVHLIPPEQDPQPLFNSIMAFIEDEVQEMPNLKPTLPEKISGIYYLLADYYFKTNEFPKAFKYYTLDLCNNPRRIDSWAGMALSQASLLETKLNSCEPINDAEFLEKSKTVEICFKQSLEISPDRGMLWIEYGAFVYAIHSFCSRIMKTEADTLSMEKFERLENQKETLLKSALECFITADAIWKHLLEINETPDQDERWLHQYMQGKIAEKQGKEPNIYMQHYMKAKELLHENNAQYPPKINYSNPQILSVEALEIYYRIHASILKYIELHETKLINKKDGNLFNECLTECANSSFVKCVSKDGEEKSRAIEIETKTAVSDVESSKAETLKRTNSNTDISNDICTKKPRLEEPEVQPLSTPPVEVSSSTSPTPTTTNDINKTENSESTENEKKEEDPQSIMDRLMKQCMEESENKLSEDVDDAEMSEIKSNDEKIVTAVQEKPDAACDVDDDRENNERPKSRTERRESQESSTSTVTSTQESSSSSESSSSDDSSDDGSSSSSSSESSDDDSEQSKQSSKTVSSKASANKSKDVALTPEHISKMTFQCIKSLELCVIRFPQHYKALYRLAYHFFHRPGDARDLNKCRQLLLNQYTCSNGAIIQGLFADRKNNNFFNGVWRIPVSEMDRPGSFASHMSRCVTLLMQVLRASGDHRTLLELCLQLKRTPDPDKKYLRETEREQLSQQALSLCVQCIRELLRAISNGKYIATNPCGTNTIVTEPTNTGSVGGSAGSAATSSNLDTNPAAQLLLDVYREYQKAQKCIPNKESLFSTLLVDIYKQYHGKIPEGVNTLELATKFCQQRISAQKNNQNNASTLNSHLIGHQTNNFQFQQSSSHKKTSKSSSSSSSMAGGRPRGRPPNINKHDLLPPINKYKYANPTAAALTNLNLPPSALNFYPFHPLLMSAASFGGKVDPSTAALSVMMQNYQELMRQYQSNLALQSFPNALTQEIAQSLLANYPSAGNPSTSTSIGNPSNIKSSNKKYSSFSNKDLGSRSSSSSTKDSYSKLLTKELMKSKSAPNKDSILKAVYGKEKSNKNKETSKQQDLYKKDINLFKDRPYISITQISPPPPPSAAVNLIPPKLPSTSNSGKTLQQKLAERQKQNSPNKNTSSSTSSVSINYPTMPIPNPFPSSSPPTAHSSQTSRNNNVFVNPYGAPIAAHSNTVTTSLKSTTSATSILPPLPQTSLLKKSKSIDTNPYIPSTSPIQISPPHQRPSSKPNTESLSITQIPKVPPQSSSSSIIPPTTSPATGTAPSNKSQTSKLLNYRKPNLSKNNSASSTATSKSSLSTSGVEYVSTLPPPPPMTKKPPPIPSPKNTDPEIIILDDD